MNTFRIFVFLSLHPLLSPPPACFGYLSAVQFCFEPALEPSVNGPSSRMHRCLFDLILEP